MFCLYVGESCEVDRAREISQSEAYLPETDLFVFCLYIGESCEVERAREKLEIYKKKLNLWVLISKGRKLKAKNGKQKGRERER